jgi:hypothetical protein
MSVLVQRRRHKAGTQAAAVRLTFPRAAPADLARFDPRTKICSMNCGRHSDDPRSDHERAFLCDECWTVAADGGLK